MATKTELLEQAEIIRTQTEENGNTADLVGGLLKLIINYVATIEDRLARIKASTIEAVIDYLLQYIVGNQGEGGNPSSSLDFIIQYIQSQKFLSLDEPNERILVHGEETDDGNGSTTQKEYFVGITELIAPDAPTIAVTTYDVVTGNANVAVTNNTTGATMWWRSSVDGGMTWTQWVTTTGSVSLASGFSNSADNANKLYKLEVKAEKVLSINITSPLDPRWHLAV